MSGSIHTFIAWAKCCAVTLGSDYVCAATYGDPIKDTMLTKIHSLRGLIRSLENHYRLCSNKFVKNGVLFVGGSKVLFSTNNSLSLDNGKSCLTEEELCQVASKIRSLCSEC